MIDHESFHISNLQPIKVFNNGIVDLHETYLLRGIESQRTHPTLILGGQPVIAFFQFVPVYESSADIDALLSTKDSTPVLSVCGFVLDREDFFHQVDSEAHELLHDQVSNELHRRSVLFNSDN